jgi:hypothetical protein
MELALVEVGGKLVHDTLYLQIAAHRVLYVDLPNVTSTFFLIYSGSLLHLQ